MQECPYFRDEKGMVQTLIKKRGGRFLLTPKYHCVLAGMGVKYSWCKVKQNFQDNQQQDPKKPGRECRKSAEVVVLSLDLVLWYAPRASDMLEVYKMLLASCCMVATKAILFAYIMKMKVMRKSHWNIAVGWMPKVAAAASARG